MRPKNFCPEQCLGKAVEVFSRLGYEGTAFSDLTAALGVNRQSLYDTYGDKLSLYLRCIEVAAERFQPRQQLFREDVSGRQALENFFEAVVQEASVAGNPGCLLTNALLDKAASQPEVATAVRRCSALTREAMEKCVQRGVEDGSISRRCEPTPTSDALFNLLAGLRVSQRTGQQGEQLRQIVRVSLRMLD